MAPEREASEVTLNSQTDQLAEQEVANAAQTEKQAADEADSEKAAAESSMSDEMPKVPSEAGDSQAEKEAAAEINAAVQAQGSQASQGMNGGMQTESTDSGIPIK